MGAGYSGLRQITAISPRYLKLDRSLVAGIDRDQERAALVRALAGYARQVGSLLIAEGVETADDLRTVRELGAPLVQGYIYARPAHAWPQISDPSRVPGSTPDVARECITVTARDELTHAGLAAQRSSQVPTL